jgi:hypothetical protein
MSEFVPDIVITAEDEIGRFCTVFLDGQKLERCFEARIKYESFDTPTFGELLIGATRFGIQDVRTILHKPRLGEFDRGGVLTRLICGKVFVQLDDQGKDLLAIVRAQDKQI